MAGTSSVTPKHVSTRGNRLAIRLLRLLWPLPGAITGAVVGFHLYFRQPGLNADSFAPLIFAGIWACGGMLSGALGTGIAAWLIQRSTHRLFSISPLFTDGLTLIFLTALCLGLYAPLEAHLPGLIWPPPQQSHAHTRPLSQPSPCTQTPPTSPNARKSWELECR